MFNVLMRRGVEDRFFSELNDIMMSAQYRVVAAVIDKTKYRIYRVLGMCILWLFSLV